MILYDKDGNLIPTEDLNTLLANPGDSALSFYVEQYGFDWSAVESIADIDALSVRNDGTLIAVKRNDTSLIIYTYSGTLSSVTVTVASGSGVALSPTNCDGVFLPSGSNLYYYDIDAGTSSLVSTFTNSIVAIGAISSSVVHVALDIGDDIKRFARYGGGSTVYSEVYWPYEIDGFGCASTGDHEVVVVSNGYYSYRAARASGVAVAWETRTQEGAVSFVYREGVYSDHYDIIVADNYIGQSASCGSVFACDFGIGVVFRYGTHEHEGNFFSISNDGRYWSIPTPLSISHEETCHLAVSGQYVYIWHGGSLSRSPVNYRFGKHSNRRIDITDMVGGGSVSVRVKAGVTLTNIVPSDSLIAMIDEEQEMLLLVAAGYQYGETVVLPQIFIGIIQSIPVVYDQTGGPKIPEIKAIDLLSFLSRQTLFSQMHDGIGHGFDTYTDENETGTEYGGMAHTGAQAGSWKTPQDEDSGEYALVPSSGGRSVAFSTFVPNALNGDIRSHCVSDGDDEAFGLCGRGQAPYLLTEAIYTPGDGIVLRHWHGEREPGTEDWKQTEMNSVDLEVGGDLWMRYYFRYALHRVATSSNGIDWAQRLESVSPIGMYPGHLGLVATQPEVDTWTPGLDPPDWPDNPYDPPPSTGRVLPTRVWFSSYHLGVYYADNFPGPETSEQPIWIHDVDGLPPLEITDDGGNGVINTPCKVLEFFASPNDPEKQAVLIDDTSRELDSSLQQNKYAIYTRNDAGTWTFSADSELFSSIVAGYGITDPLTIYGIRYTGSYLIAFCGAANYWLGGEGTSHYVYIMRSSDNGATWSYTRSPGSGSVLVGLRACDASSDGHVIIISASSRAKVLHISSDGGATFSDEDISLLISQLRVFNGGVAYCSYGGTFCRFNGTDTPIYIGSPEFHESYNSTWYNGIDADRLDQNHMIATRYPNVASGYSYQYVTHDGFNSYVMDDEFATSGHVGCTWTPVLSNESGYFDYIFYGRVEGLGISDLHPLAVRDSEDSIVHVGKSGSNFSTHPYINSIPTICGNASKGGLVVA